MVRNGLIPAAVPIVAIKKANSSNRLAGCIMKIERLIWRPNCIPAEQWEAMDRADQIAWWKADQAKQPISVEPTPARLVEAYNSEYVTLFGFVSKIFEVVTDENIIEFAKTCPVDLWEQIEKEVASLPPDGDDAQWSEIRILCSGGIYPPWFDAEEERKSREESNRKCIARMRHGVRLIRAISPR